MKITPIYNKKVMDKNLDSTELRKLVREMMARKQNTVQEDDEESLGIYGGDFDEYEFDNDAMAAAMADIKASGDEFEHLGKSKFEKNLDPSEFKADLKRQNLNLPNDKKELKNIQNTLDKRYKHEKQFGAGSLNEDSNTFDTKSLYDFLKDALYHCEKHGLDYAQSAKVIEDALLEKFDVTKKNKVNFSLNENPEANHNVNPNSKIDRPKDAEGQPITNGARVEDLDTGTIGHVKHPGIDENGNQTIHVDWMYSFGDAIVKPITYPNKIVVRDENRIVREDEIEEGMGHSHTIGRGQNIKPGNYPKTLKRKGLNEEFDYAAEERAFHNKENYKEEQEVYLVIDNDFNRAHYKDLIGKTFEDAPPAYAQVKVINKNETPKIAEEDFDYAAAEREHAGQQEMDSMSEEAINYVPENLQKFLVPGSFDISDANESNGQFEYNYTLKIPKQSDETLLDIEKFIKEEEPYSYGGPGQSYQKVNLYTELEKATNNWISKINVTRGFDV